ncbi:MAG: P-loop NTPase fold protein [Candidatus Kaiserbacteria bacterium]|nr:P-loop NTPase fold protein [Candidatus Kaiserbacteria bacterium]
MDVTKDPKESQDGLVGSGMIIPIDPLFDHFKHHLEMLRNSRILFSGKFGIGKTFFIERFFKQYEEYYFWVRLRPTAYQIVGSEVLIETMKEDLMISIMEQGGEKGPLSGHKEKSKMKKLVKIGWKTASLLGRVNPIANFIVAAIEEIKESFGTITEEKIRKMLCKVAGKEKKKVLVIDDMDRLDPEHIFRLFNVFSLFVGEDEEKTVAKRLGFDHVIFVADYNNLRSIFHHKYGAGTDSQGYLDKFYSKEVFEYDPKGIIAEYMGTVFGPQPNKQVTDKTGQYISVWLSLFLLKNFFRKNIINLRQVLNGLGTLQYSQKRNSSGFSMIEEREYGRPMKRTVSFLIKTVGSKKALVDAIKQSLSNDCEPIVDNKYGQSDMFDGLRDHCKFIVSAVNLSHKAPFLPRLLKGRHIEGLVVREGELSIKGGDVIHEGEVLKTFKDVLLLYIEEFHGDSIPSVRG